MREREREIDGCVVVCFDHLPAALFIGREIVKESNIIRIYSLWY